MGLTYNPETDEFEIPDFAWEREVCRNHEFFGKKLGFENVTMWRGGGKEKLVVGLKPGAMLVNFSDSVCPENLLIVPMDSEDAEAISMKARQTFARFIQPGSNWEVIFEDTLFHKEYNGECPRCFSEGTCVAAASRVRTQQLEWWNYCPNCGLNTGPYRVQAYAEYEWRG